MELFRDLAPRVSLHGAAPCQAAAPGPIGTLASVSVGQDAQNRPPVTYSCGGCDTRWSGVSRCHCAGCHRTFAGANLFDRHRRDIKGESGCLDPETIVSKSDQRKGEREMFLTANLWQGVETPAPRRSPVASVTPVTAVTPLFGAAGNAA